LKQTNQAQSLSVRVSVLRHSNRSPTTFGYITYYYYFFYITLYS